MSTQHDPYSGCLSRTLLVGDVPVRLKKQCDTLNLECWSNAKNNTTEFSATTLAITTFLAKYTKRHHGNIKINLLEISLKNVDLRKLTMIAFSWTL